MAEIPRRCPRPKHGPGSSTAGVPGGGCNKPAHPQSPGLPPPSAAPGRGYAPAADCRPLPPGKQAVLYILMRFGSVRFNEMKRHWQHFRQNPERHIEGAGGGPAGQPGGQIPPKVEYSPGERPCSPFWTVCANGGNRTGCKAGISAECPLILPMELCYNSGSYNRREDFHVRTFQVA